jgi:type IV pilus assembly protein PilM
VLASASTLTLFRKSVSPRGFLTGGLEPARVGLKSRAARRERHVAFGKKKGLVGLDIGSSAIKAVELKPGGKGGEFHLVNLGMEPLPPEAIVDGAIMDSGAVIDSIQRLFSANKIKTNEVATSVSGNAVIVKKISLPQMTPEELAESIHWEAEQYIPFDIQDVALDYEVVEGSGSGGNMDVLLVASKKDKIGDYTSAISQAGKTPTIVEVDVFALQNCYEVNYGIDPGRVIALLNVGASIMNINIVKGSNSIFNRDIAVGGNQYTDAIQKDLNLSFDQAEALKRGARVEGAAPENLGPILRAVSDNITLEIQKTFDFFKATSSEDRIDRIFLAGGTSKVPGLRELLADRFDAGVEILNPFNNVIYNPREFDPDFIAEIGPSAAVAVGLAVRRVGDR